MVSMARWMRQNERVEEALEMFRRAVKENLGDRLLFRSLWDMALLERKQGRRDSAVALWSELAGCRNPHQAAALVELAKHYEHHEKNFAMALDFVNAALAAGETDELAKRRDRLQRLAKAPRTARLL
jgi:tetratricopeptide (TPR) repeat protein